MTQNSRMQNRFSGGVGTDRGCCDEQQCSRICKAPARSHYRSCSDWCAWPLMAVASGEWRLARKPLLAVTVAGVHVRSTGARRKVESGADLFIRNTAVSMF